MEWSTILMALLSGTSIGGIVEAIRYRQMNKQMKENEAIQSTVETQEKEINLANLYKEEMLKLFEQMKQNQSENVGNQKEMIEQLTNLDKRLDGMEERMAVVEQKVKGIDESTSNLVEFSNGEFKAFMDKKKKAKK